MLHMRGRSSRMLLEPLLWYALPSFCLPVLSSPPFRSSPPVPFPSFFPFFSFPPPIRDRRGSCLVQPPLPSLPAQIDLPPITINQSIPSPAPSLSLHAVDTDHLISPFPPISMNSTQAAAAAQATSQTHAPALADPPSSSAVGGPTARDLDTRRVGAAWGTSSPGLTAHRRLLTRERLIG